MEKRFHKKLVNQLTGYGALATPAEYKELIDEVSEFRKGIKDLPMAKQHKLFMQEYGGMVETMDHHQLMMQLNSISKTLNFFKVIAIISLLVAAIGIFQIFA